MTDLPCCSVSNERDDRSVGRGSFVLLPLPLVNLLESREFGELLCRAVENHSGKSGPSNFTDWLTLFPSLLEVSPFRLQCIRRGAMIGSFSFCLVGSPRPPTSLPRFGVDFFFPPNTLFHQNLIGWMFQEPRNREKEGNISKEKERAGNRTRTPASRLMCLNLRNKNRRRAVEWQCLRHVVIVLWLKSDPSCCRDKQRPDLPCSRRWAYMYMFTSRS